MAVDADGTIYDARLSGTTSGTPAVFKFTGATGVETLFQAASSSENVLSMGMQLPATLPGDANDDGVVDAADYIILKQHFGTSTGAGATDGDFNYDGAVDWNDLQMLMSAFSAGGGAPATNPEPATLSLLALGVLAVIRRTRK